jgi:GNAT superfamily N-acetyltransferase
MTAPVQTLGIPTARDLDDLVSLIRLLGYTLDSDVLSARLARLSVDAGHETWVVRDSDDRITAVAGGRIVWAYNDDAPTAELLLLVVSEAGRRDGLGSRLLGHVEAWANTHGARVVNAVGAAATDTASRFYRKRGYHEAGVRYSKLI